MKWPEDEMLLPPKKIRGSQEDCPGNTVWLYGGDSSWGGSQDDNRLRQKLQSRLDWVNANNHLKAQNCQRSLTMEELKAIRIFEHHHGPLKVARIYGNEANFSI
jgi:hypothetical protein